MITIPRSDSGDEKYRDIMKYLKENISTQPCYDRGLFMSDPDSWDYFICFRSTVIEIVVRSDEHSAFIKLKWS
jgi:hypothetical protein